MLLMSFSVCARKPAVEPIMGISIDNEPKVTNPSLAQGYSFSAHHEAKRLPQSEGALPPILQQKSDTDRTIPVFFITLMVLLPAIVWFGIMRNIQISRVDESLQSKPHEKKSEKVEDHEEEIEYKKAS